MNRNTTWAVVGLVVLLLIVGLVVMNTNNDTEVATDSQTEVAGTQNQQQSLKELMASNKPVKCEYSDTQADGSSVKGTSYIANGQVRGDFSSTANGQTMTGHMIMKDNMVYTWVDGQKTGYKMSVNASTTAQTSQQQVNVDQKMNYDCDNWNADNSMFTLPAGVTFTDMNAFLKTQGGASVNSGASQCASCDQLPAQYQAQCRSQLCPR
jgi:hypothetical protein